MVEAAAAPSVAGWVSSLTLAISSRWLGGHRLPLELWGDNNE